MDTTMTDLTTIETKYREAALVLKQMDTKKCSLKKCISNLSDYLTDLEKKAIYALACNAEKNRESINKMKKFCLDESKKTLNPYLLSVLLGKLMFERKVALYSLPQGIPETEFIVENRRKLGSMKGRQQEAQTHIYLRINLLKAHIEEMIPILLLNGFNHNTIESDSFESFVTNCHALKMRSFIKDFHFPDELIVFRPCATKYLTCLDIYKSGKIIIQDKASLLAVKAMKLKKNMNVLDVCCAPGTKTAAMAACMENEGAIISIDRDSNRLHEMRILLNRLGVKCCETIHGDFLELAQNYMESDIDVLLLDPSCSGTGRPDISKDQVDAQRIGKLAGFQTMMLKAAFTLGAKKIIYSTCSIDMFENEVVIGTAMKESPEAANYTIVDPMPDWPMRSPSNTPFADKVIRSDKSLLTRGFFFCLFERNDITRKQKKNKKKKLPDQ